MYDRYIKLLEEKGVKTSDVCRATGIVASTFSDWKKGKSIPKQDKIKKIADYFNVSVDYLIDGKENEKEQYSSEMAMLLRKIRNDKEMSQALIKYFGLSEEKKKHVVDMINMLSEV